MTDERADSVRDLVLAGVLRSAPLSVFAFDDEGRCLFSQGAALQFMGLEPDELVGSNLFELYADRGAGVDRMRRALSGETFLATDTVLDHTYETWYLPLGRLPGNGCCALGISVDVTARVRAEVGEQLYRAFVQAAPQFIALAGLDGSVMYVNPGGRRLAGIPDDVDVTTTSITDYLTPDGIRASVEVEQPAVMRDGRWEGESTLKHWPTAEGIPVQVSSFLVRNMETGEPLALATVQSDIREVVAGRDAVQRQIAYQRGMFVHLHEAQATERQRIAADIHDDTVQVMAAVNLRLQTLRRDLEQVMTPERAGQLAAMDQSVRDATDRLRRLLGVLDLSEAAGDVTAGLRRAAATVFDSRGPAARVLVDIDTDPSPIVERTIVRIATEGLINIRKHADASTVDVLLDQEAGEYVLRVLDDGRGLSAETSRDSSLHRGVRGMRERAESVGGTLAVATRQSGGVAVEARLPNFLGHPDEPVLLEQSRKYLEQVVDDLDQSYIAIDSDWRYVFVNRAGYRLAGRDPSESLVGKRIWDEFEVVPELVAAYHRAMDEQVPLEVTAHDPALDRWVYNRILPTAGGLTIFARDVTEDRAAAALAGRQGRLVSAGRAVIAAATADVDAEVALRAAAEALIATWPLRGIRVSRDGAQVVVAGELSGPARRLPLLAGGATIGSVDLVGEEEPVDDDMVRLFALRLSTMASG